MNRRAHPSILGGPTFSVKKIPLTFSAILGDEQARTPTFYLLALLWKLTGSSAFDHTGHHPGATLQDSNSSKMAIDNKFTVSQVNGESHFFTMCASRNGVSAGIAA